MAVVDGSTLSAAEVVALVEADSLAVDAGCDLLDADDNLIDDITDDLIASGSSVELGVYNTIHRTCTLNLSRQLQWGSQRVKPYLLLSADGVTFYRWPLGVFVLTTPELAAGESPATFSVSGYDKLQVLDTPYGASYTLAAGAAIIAAVEALIGAAGESSIAIDQTSAATVAAATMTFSIVDSEDWTTLRICNQLLDAVGYRALYVDRDGRYRSEPYRAPGDLPTVWDYSTSSGSTTVGEQRTFMADYFDAANVIIGINDNPELPAPQIGSGIFEVSNPADGPTSIAERGRSIKRIMRGSWASQSALETAVTAALTTEKRITNMVEVAVSPNPVHGHFDVVSYTDPDLGVSDRFLVQSWSLPLDGSDMSLTLRSV